MWQDINIRNLRDDVNRFMVFELFENFNDIWSLDFYIRIVLFKLEITFACRVMIKS